jgi:hypothetical protein
MLGDTRWGSPRVRELVRSYIRLRVRGETLLAAQTLDILQPLVGPDLVAALEERIDKEPFA